MCACQKAQETKYNFQAKVMALASTVWLMLRPDLLKAGEVDVESITLT